MSFNVFLAFLDVLQKRNLMVQIELFTYIIEVSKRKRDTD